MRKHPIDTGFRKDCTTRFIWTMTKNNGLKADFVTSQMQAGSLAKKRQQSDAAIFIIPHLDSFIADKSFRCYCWRIIYLLLLANHIPIRCQILLKQSDSIQLIWAMTGAMAAMLALVNQIHLVLPFFFEKLGCGRTG